MWALKKWFVTKVAHCKTNEIRKLSEISKFSKTNEISKISKSNEISKICQTIDIM